MKIPFFDLFKRSNPRLDTPQPRPRSVVRPSPVNKAEGDRLSKTVMPNATRTVTPEDTSEAVKSPLREPAPDGLPVKPRTVSFGPSRKKANKDLPPAVALALEPRVERAVSLELADIVTQLPAGLAKPPESFDSSRRILLKASELERGMAQGKPTTSIGSIYQQAPEIFLRPVAATDTTQIALPFAKVLEAFMQMQVRRDQVRDQAVPQVETPFLKATIEDNERFGLPSEPPEISEMPPMRLEPATAEAIAATAEALAAAEPETMVREKVTSAPQPAEERPGAPLRIPLVEGAAEESAMTPGQGTGKAAPERILFQLPPKETGVPATERVPASCGPPVSTPLPRPPEAARIPFQIPSKDGQGKPAPLSVPRVSAPGPNAEKKISLALKPILQSLPVFELTGDPKEAPDDARIEFSFLLIQPQLASGRVVVPPELFERSLPPECRRFFSAKDLQMPVSLPLQEVLKNLPPDTLQMRDDQEEREAGETIKTPFLAKAEEDAKLFKKELTPIAKTAAEATAAAVPEPDAKSMIAQASQLPGIRACAVSFADGLNLAGNLPADIGAEGLCAIAPALLDRIGTHVRDTQIGELNALTLHCAKSTVTFFRHANVCLAALHTNGELMPAVREELARMLEQLSRIYSQPR